MGWEPEMLDGARVVAALWEDSGARLARRHLPAEAARYLAAEVPASERRRHWRSLVDRLRPGVGDASELPPRARALLAATVPRERGRRFLAEAGPPRAGFQPDPALATLLARWTTHRGVAGAG